MKYRALAAALIAVLLTACADDGPRSARTAAPLYDMLAVGPAAVGVQVSRPFAVSLLFFQPGTLVPYDQPDTEKFSVSVASGPGMLTGQVSQYGNGSSSVSFDNLVLDSVGTYQLRFSAPSSTSDILTAVFEVGPQMDLHFSLVPAQTIAGRDFSVELQTVIPGTTTPVTPGYPVHVNLEIDGTLASQPLLGPASAVITSGSTVVSGLKYNATEPIAIWAAAPGFAPVRSPVFVVDALALEFVLPPTSVLVNGTFSLTAQILGTVSGQPISPQPPITAQIAVDTGAGALAGATPSVSAGSTITFANLRYSQIGTATFAATSSEAASAISDPIDFGLAMQVGTSGPTTVIPNGAFGAFSFRLVDGTGAGWTGVVSPLNWQLRGSSGHPVQSGTSGFSAGTASATPQPVAITGSYELVGSIQFPGVAQASIGISVTSLAFINQPGPFVALKTCREGTPYFDSVSASAPPGTLGFGLLSGFLPPGMTLNAGNGTISGTANTAGSYAFTLYAQLPGLQAQAIRCALAVFSPTEKEIVQGQNFREIGPYGAVGPVRESFTFNSSYDGNTWPSTGSASPPWAPCRVEYFYPNFILAPSPAPVFVFHRGRGFNMVDYRVLAMHIASHGYIVASVEDYQSFIDGGAAAQHDHAGNPQFSAGAQPLYDQQAAERGMMSASAFQEAAMRWLLEVSQTAGHVLHGRVDAERVFAGGHSRGGGATHASHVRSKPYWFNGSMRQNINLRGVVYFMPFDLRYFTSTVAGSADVYAVPTSLARLPSLVIAAENDGDLVYPVADQLIDRATGPMTFATVYGGCHAYISDAGNFDAALATITRQHQQVQIGNLVVAFLKRWSNLDVSLDGMLYGAEYAGSDEVGICSWRNMMETVMIDTHQSATPSFNMLGGFNQIIGGSFTTSGSVYPALGYLFTTEARHNILTLNGGTTAAYSMTVPSQYQNQSRTRRLILRCGTVDQLQEPLKGYDWATIRVRLTSGHHTATVTVFDRAAQNSNYLPDYTGGHNVYDRFVNLSVPFSRFVLANPQFDRAQISKVELVFETAAGPSRQFYLDDIRFE